MNRFIKLYGPALLTLIIAIMFFEFITQKEWIPSFLFPAPSAVLKSLGEMSSDYSQAFTSTLTSTLIGLTASAVVGILVAIMFSMNVFLKRALFPFAVFFQTVPIIAIAPLMVIWFGFGEPTVRASAFIVSLFPILANTLVGLDSTDKNLLELFRFYRASKLKTLFKLKIPCAYPYIISGLRIAAGLSVVGAIVGEFVGGGGLGALIDSARTQQRVEIVFAAVLLSSLLGLLLIAGINLCDRAFLKWKPLKQNSE